jgi:Ca2+-binding EF-hand superfamily protein
MDRDGRGQLETAEFRRGLNEIGFSCSDRDATELFIQFDTDGSGKVNLEEFLNQTRVREVNC